MGDDAQRGSSSGVPSGRDPSAGTGPSSSTAQSTAQPTPQSTSHRVGVLERLRCELTRCASGHAHHHAQLHAAGRMIRHGDDEQAGCVMTRRRELAAVLVVAALVFATGVLYALAPHGVGGQVYPITTVALFLLFGAGPLLRGARPLLPWLVLLVVSLGLVLAVVPLIRTGSFGPHECYNPPYLAAYVLMLIWVNLMPLYVGGGHERMVVIDSFAAAAGAILTLWCVLIMPVGSLPVAVTAYYWALFPPMDLVMVVLLVQMNNRIGVRTCAVKWLVVGFALWTVLDGVYVWLAVRTGGTDHAALAAGYLAAHFFLALGATRADIVEFTRPPARTSLPARNDPKAVNVILMLWPLVLCTFIPSQGLHDSIVRTTLVALIAVLVYARITGTMKALRRAELHNAERARRDPLTGLHNRAALMEHLGRTLARNGVEGSRSAVYYFDCDRFKHINDTWGHKAGDDVLREVARRLVDNLPADMLMVRQGGDEFVLVESVATPQQAFERADQVLDLLRAPSRIASGRLETVTHSLGVVVTEPGEPLDVDGLLVRADLAMFEAKHAGGDRWVAFDPSLADLARLPAGRTRGADLKSRTP